jgi:protein gp37
MSANSKIEWTDHTFNPWIGCTKVSPGCVNCYAETRDKRHLIEPIDHWGKGAPRLRTSGSNWKQPLKWNREAELDYDDASRDGCAHLHHRPRVFCASLADIFDDEVPIEWLADFLALVHKCQNLDFQILTKRPENFEARIAAARPTISFWRHGNAPDNVWLGVSVEDQKRADERIPLLLQIPAKVRFLSCEPLLGSVDIAKWLVPDECGCGGYDPAFKNCIDWVIVGGESGPNARPMHPDWARSLRDQCGEVGVRFFFKQWGEWEPGTIFYNKGDHQFEGGQIMHRTGKRSAGRRLDGREWNEFPSEKSAQSAVVS